MGLPCRLDTQAKRGGQSVRQVVRNLLTTELFIPYRGLDIEQHQQI